MLQKIEKNIELIISLIVGIILFVIATIMLSKLKSDVKNFAKENPSIQPTYSNFKSQINTILASIWLLSFLPAITSWFVIPKFTKVSYLLVGITLVVCLSMAITVTIVLRNNFTAKKVDITIGLFVVILMMNIICLTSYMRMLFHDETKSIEMVNITKSNNIENIQEKLELIPETDTKSIESYSHDDPLLGTTIYSEQFKKLFAKIDSDFKWFEFDLNKQFHYNYHMINILNSVFQSYLDQENKQKLTNLVKTVNKLHTDNTKLVSIYRETFNEMMSSLYEPQNMDGNSNLSRELKSEVDIDLDKIHNTMERFEQIYKQLKTARNSIEHLDEEFTKQLPDIFEKVCIKQHIPNIFQVICLDKKMPEMLNIACIKETSEEKLHINPKFKPKNSWELLHNKFYNFVQKDLPLNDEKWNTIERLFENINKIKESDDKLDIINYVSSLIPHSDLTRSVYEDTWQKITELNNEIKNPGLLDKLLNLWKTHVTKGKPTSEMQIQNQEQLNEQFEKNLLLFSEPNKSTSDTSQEKEVDDLKYESIDQEKETQESLRVDKESVADKYKKQLLKTDIGEIFIPSIDLINEFTSRFEICKKQANNLNEFVQEHGNKQLFDKLLATAESSLQKNSQYIQDTVTKVLQDMENTHIEILEKQTESLKRKIEKTIIQEFEKIISMLKTQISNLQKIMHTLIKISEIYDIIIINETKSQSNLSKIDLLLNKIEIQGKFEKDLTLMKEQNNKIFSLMRQKKQEMNKFLNDFSFQNTIQFLNVEELMNIQGSIQNITDKIDKLENAMKDIFEQKKQINDDLRPRILENQTLCSENKEYYNIIKQHKDNFWNNDDEKEMIHKMQSLTENFENANNQLCSSTNDLLLSIDNDDANYVNTLNELNATQSVIENITLLKEEIEKLLSENKENRLIKEFLKLNEDICLHCQDNFQKVANKLTFVQQFANNDEKKIIEDNLQIVSQQISTSCVLIKQATVELSKWNDDKYGKLTELRNKVSQQFETIKNLIRGLNNLLLGQLQIIFPSKLTNDIEKLQRDFENLYGETFKHQVQILKQTSDQEKKSEQSFISNLKDNFWEKIKK